MPGQQPTIKDVVQFLKSSARPDLSALVVALDREVNKLRRAEEAHNRVFGIGKLPTPPAPIYEDKVPDPKHIRRVLRKTEGKHAG